MQKPLYAIELKLSASLSAVTQHFLITYPVFILTSRGYNGLLHLSPSNISRPLNLHGFQCQCPDTVRLPPPPNAGPADEETEV